ncbi:MAG: response regulator [Bacteroidetes bacterium]|jgi:two-component system response regulator HydG|nr:response regulator [Bacteroidota bacterium]
MKKILIVDDDTYICDLLVHFLTQKNFKTDGTYSGNNAIKKMKSNTYDLILCDYRLPDADGLEVLRAAKAKDASLPVIIMTAYADVQMAVKLIKEGAYDYVTKPIQQEETLKLIEKATEKENKEETSVEFESDFITGHSQKIQAVMNHVKAVGPTELTVLVEGETGSGKEYIARAIHHASHRDKKPFIAVDCGALPKEIANSELFGHVKGSFTGALKDKKGYFEIAKGGTLFLDEVGNLNYENQIKLLRAIQERVITRVGDEKKIPIDVRIIAATNDDLWLRVDENNFREDLYHRLNGFKIQIPALRERTDDIFEFVDQFIEKANNDFNKKVLGPDDEVKQIFTQYSWPGNIRELLNVVKRSVLLATSEYITIDTLPDEILQSNIESNFTPLDSVTQLRDATSVAEREVIENALRETNFNKSKAAQLLNIDRKTLYNKIKQLDIQVQPG